MKKVKLLAACMVCCLCISAQTNTGYLQITLHKNLLLGACNLDSASNTIYMHGGAGLTVSTVWDVVVGHWGIPDGVGQMTTIDDSTYTTCMDLTNSASNYFVVNPIDSGSFSPGQTIYNLGAVFRDQGPFPMNAQGQFELDVHLKGASDDVDCSDIWILHVNTNSVNVVSAFDGSQVYSVTDSFVSSCSASGIGDITSQLMNEIQVSPNPFSDHVNIKFNMIPDETKVYAQVYDVMGRKVADFTPGIHGGFNYFSWDGVNMNGGALPTGAYLLKVTNGSKVLTQKLIKE